MLGTHADAFFNKQANERVIASTPNAHGGSYAPFDMEKSGTKTAMVQGNYEMPGPQNTVQRVSKSMFILTTSGTGLVITFIRIVSSA